MKKIVIRITQQNNDLDFKTLLFVKDLKELVDLFKYYESECEYIFMYFIDDVVNAKKSELEYIEERVKSLNIEYDNYSDFQRFKLLDLLIKKGAIKK